MRSFVRFTCGVSLGWDAAWLPRLCWYVPCCARQFDSAEVLPVLGGVEEPERRDVMDFILPSPGRHQSLGAPVARAGRRRGIPDSIMRINGVGRAVFAAPGVVVWRPAVSRLAVRTRFVACT
ncbi:hypothetical protein GCM10010433_05440 [Streptomyces pulveraceus]